MILLYIVRLLHLIVFLFAIGAPFIFNDNMILGILIIFYLLIVTHWYILSECIFTPLEEYLGYYQEVYKHAKNKSFMTERSKYPIEWIIVLYPTFATLICVLKILNNCNK